MVGVWIRWASRLTYMAHVMVTKNDYSWHGKVAHRKTFQGLQQTDFALTISKMTNMDAPKQGLLRCALNGTQFTSDALIHAGKVTHIGWSVAKMIVRSTNLGALAAESLADSRKSADPFDQSLLQPWMAS